jgi:hypothetical protein
MEERVVILSERGERRISSRYMVANIILKEILRFAQEDNSTFSGR